MVLTNPKTHKLHWHISDPLWQVLNYFILKFEGPISSSSPEKKINGILPDDLFNRVAF
jgi:hypothetical protein